MMRRTKRVLADEQWARIEPHLPKYVPSARGGRPRANDRECLEGILWLLRSGARWRDVPVDMPSGCTCWRRLQEWAGEGILEEIHAQLIEELGTLGKLHLKELLADATFIRAKKGETMSAKPSAARV
jgi:transposase